MKIALFFAVAWAAMQGIAFAQNRGQIPIADQIKAMPQEVQDALANGERARIKAIKFLDQQITETQQGQRVGKTVQELKDEQAKLIRRAEFYPAVLDTKSMEAGEIGWIVAYRTEVSQVVDQSHWIGRVQHPDGDMVVIYFENFDTEKLADDQVVALSQRIFKCTGTHRQGSATMRSVQIFDMQPFVSPEILRAMVKIVQQQDAENKKKVP
jgi:hypothetical protein